MAVLIAIPSIALTVAGIGLAAMPFFVEHGSMSPTLQPGELLLVDTVGPRMFGVDRGDIVIFEPPVPGYGGAPFVKRVVAVGGDNVAIHAGSVFVDGNRVPEAPGVTPDTTFPDETMIRVPVGSLFVLGDNRQDSFDSRSFGVVPLTDLVGRVWLRV